MVAGGLAILAAAGCASRSAEMPTSADATSSGKHAAASGTTARGGGPLSSPRADPDNLAPAGPAPGGTSGKAEGEGDANPAATAIATSAGCEDTEPQSHLPSVDEQLSCRRGTEHAYVMTFRSTTDRDAYLTRGPQVVPGGFNVVGPTWVVHVESSSTAHTLGTRLKGTVRAGS
jgi:hypothetical protein